MAAVLLVEDAGAARISGEEYSKRYYSGELPKFAPANADDSPLFGVGAHDSTLHVHAVLAHSTGPVQELETTRRRLLEQVNAGSATLLSPRDICKVDPRFASRLEPCIYVRHGALLVSLGSQALGAVILHDRVCLLAPSPTHPLLLVAKTCLGQRREWREQARGEQLSAVTFELMALEALLAAACTELHDRTTFLANHVKGELAELTSHGTIQLTVGTDWLGIVSEVRSVIRGARPKGTHTRQARRDRLRSHRAACRTSQDTRPLHGPPHGDPPTLPTSSVPSQLID